MHGLDVCADGAAVFLQQFHFQLLSHGFPSGPISIKADVEHRGWHAGIVSTLIRQANPDNTSQPSSCLGSYLWHLSSRQAPA